MKRNLDKRMRYYQGRIDPSLTFGYETVKIILNTKGTMDDVPPEMKRLFARRQSEDGTNIFVPSERARGVKYPAPWGR